MRCAYIYVFSGADGNATLDEAWSLKSLDIYYSFSSNVKSIIFAGVVCLYKL